MSNQEIKNALSTIYLTLNEMDVKGDKNVSYLTGVFNVIKSLMEELDTQETSTEE